jgi:hypothetical protein
MIPDLPSPVIENVCFFLKFIFIFWVSRNFDPKCEQRKTEVKDGLSWIGLEVPNKYWQITDYLKRDGSNHKSVEKQNILFSIIFRETSIR